VTDIDPKWIETAAKALADAANQTEGATDDARCLTDEAECFQTYPVHFAWYQNGQTGIVGETAAVARMVLEAAAGLIAERAAADARADIAQRFTDLGITTILASDAASIALTGQPRPRICHCGHPQAEHRDQWAGYTERDMTRSPNRGSCTTNCGCRTYRQDDAAAAVARRGES
jgi:hypothetical protein